MSDDIALTTVDHGGQVRTRGQLVDRLRKSRAAAIDIHRSHGRELGEYWAMEFAEYVELQRLEELAHSADTTDMDAINGSDRPADDLAEKIDLGLSADEFWERLLGDDASDPSNPRRGAADTSSAASSKAP